MVRAQQASPCQISVEIEVHRLIPNTQFLVLSATRNFDLSRLKKLYRNIRTYEIQQVVMTSWVLKIPKGSINFI